MYALLFLPAAVCFLLPLVNAVVQNHREQRERREAEERRRIKAEAAARAKAERAAQKAAARAARQAEAAAVPRRKRGRPRKNPEPALEASAAVPPIPVFKRPESVSGAAPIVHGNNAFAGQTVAFTGTLPNMTRAEAIAAVTANGGRAYDTMTAGTTLLVVGDKPGMNKLDKADRWIGQVRKITPAQFDAMLKLPLTLTPDEFAAMIAAR